MIIYPAIDIKDGKCVRLVQGDFNDVTIYSENPVKMALKWEEAGAKYLHVVDLDGAKYGSAKNLEVISRITSKLEIPVQLGGGIRTIDAIEKVFNKGICRVILGTSAVKNPELVKKALSQYGDKIIIGIDAKNGAVAINGWENTSDFNAIQFALKMEEMGAETFIYTDISRDGMLAGPNLKAMTKMIEAVNVDVIASGGVSKIQDIVDLKKTGVSGVIIGKALYTKNIDLKQAIQYAI